MAGESAGLSIPWDDPEVNTDVTNIYQHQGERIDIDTSSEADEAMKVAQRIYADAGHTMDAGDLKDLRNRILGGQSLAEIAANTYDQAKRRFPDEGSNQSSTVSEPGQADSQLNIGRTYDPPDVMMEQLITGAREVADLQDAWPATSPQMSPMGNSPRVNYGPAHGAYGGGSAMTATASASGSPFPWGLVLIGAAVIVGGYLLLRKKGK